MIPFVFEKLLELGVPFIVELFSSFINHAIANGNHSKAGDALGSLVSIGTQVATNVADAVAEAAKTGDSEAVKTAALHTALSAVATPGGGQGAAIKA